MLGRIASSLKAAGLRYSDDNCLSHGAAIAYYTIFSLAPVLLIVIAVAGLMFGEAAARGAVVDRISGLMGQSGADAVQSMLQGAASKKSGIIATVSGVVILLVTASGVFGEMQAALNQIWEAKPRAGAVSALIRARLQGLGLVITLGFLLMVSLVVSAVLAAFGSWMSAHVPGVQYPLLGLNFVVSLALTSLLFGVIYKVLPDAEIAWRDVAIGAVVTAVLFAVGRYLIGLYVAHSSLQSSYGAAGAFAVILVWIYYSSQIFLFGAEFTRCWSDRHGSRADAAIRARREALLADDGHAGEIARLKTDLDQARITRAPRAAPPRPPPDR